MKLSTDILDNTTTFENVYRLHKNFGGSIYIKLNNNELVKCECWKKPKKATLAFDLYTRACNHDLLPETQKMLEDEHKCYINEEYLTSGYNGTIQCTFSASVIYFDVLPQDAEIWFRKIVAILNNSTNLKKQEISLY